MNKEKTLLIASLSGLVAVGLGAFGAHGLKDILTANDRIDTFKLAVDYQFYHTLAMLAVGILMNTMDSKLFRYASLCFFVGIIFFSGSLYILALTNIKILGAITPLGGVLFIAGWALLAGGIAVGNKK